MVGLFALLTLIFPSMPKALEPPREATLLFAGDAMQHQSQIDAARQGTGYDYSGCFGILKPYIEDADLAIVNFEASLGGSPYTGYPCFSAPDSYARSLKDAGFDFFLLANNHILDRRDKGLHRTIATLDSLDMPHAGIYHCREDKLKQTPHILTVNGFRIGLVNYTYGTNGIEVQREAVVNYIDTKEIEAEIKRCQEYGAELICACIHWGDEYKLLPNASQKVLADKLVKSGVDMVIGGHPHVIQPMEMRPRPDGTNALVVYSLGNFISAMKTDDTRGGATVRVTLRRDNRGNAYVADAKYALVYVDNGFVVKPVQDAVDPHAKIFRRNAERVFNAHNINVPPDSSFMHITPACL